LRSQSRKSHKLTDERRAEIEAEVRRKYRPEEFAEKEAPRAAEPKATTHSSSSSPDAKMEAIKEVLSAAVNPVELAKRIRDLAATQNRHKIKEGLKRAGGAAAAGNEAFFRLPSKIKPVKKYLEKFEEENPDAAKVGEVVGTF
jgi:hypothetical protein